MFPTATVTKNTPIHYKAYSVINLDALLWYNFGGLFQSSSTFPTFLIAVMRYTYFIVRAIKWRRIRWAGHIARLGESRGAYRSLVEKPQGKRQLLRPRRRWEDNIKMDLQEVGCDGMDWIDVAQVADNW